MIYQQYIDAVDSTHNVGRVLVPGPERPLPIPRVSAGM